MHKNLIFPKINMLKKNIEYDILDSNNEPQYSVKFIKKFLTRKIILRDLKTGMESLIDKNIWIKKFSIFIDNEKVGSMSDRNMIKALILSIILSLMLCILELSFFYSYLIDKKLINLNNYNGHIAMFSLYWFIIYIIVKGVILKDNFIFKCKNYDENLYSKGTEFILFEGEEKIAVWDAKSYHDHIPIKLYKDNDEILLLSLISCIILFKFVNAEGRNSGP